MEICDAANPIGEAKIDDAVETYVNIMTAEWDKAKGSIPWWQFWKRNSMVRVTNFLLKSIDDLIAYVDELVDLHGSDKKATVLRAVELIYDYIVKEAMPIWLKPFAGRIKEIIILDVISPAIDWMVAKYRDGSWNKNPAEEIAAQWQLKAQMMGVPGGHRPK
jgi:hypothetical protein